MGGVYVGFETGISLSWGLVVLKTGCVKQNKGGQ